MNSNLAIIFLALLIGVVIGFEIGKFKAVQKVKDILDSISESMLKTAKAEEAKRKERIDSLKEVLQLMEKAKEEANKEDKIE